MKDINGYEGRYAVTEDGRVWAYPKKTVWKKYQNGHFLSMRNSGFYKNRGQRVQRKYKRVCLATSDGNKDFYVHRLVAQTFIPNPLDLPEVNHINADGADNRVCNLEWCDRKHNARHTIKTGTSTRGNRNSQCKLTEDNVRQIRILLSDGKTQQSIANIFGVTQSLIYAINKKKIWYWLA